LREVSRKYSINRYRNDPVYKLKVCISNDINRMLNTNGASKNGESCSKYLPFTFLELKQHLENQFDIWMTWKNRGKYNPKTWKNDDISTWKWQIDHIIPKSEFPYTSMEDENFRKCWALENLRPYSAKQNIIDGATRIRHKKENINEN